MDLWELESSESPRSAST